MTEQENMNRLQLLTILSSIKTLLETGNQDKALELINTIIDETKQEH